MVGSPIWACAAIEPGNALPNNANNAIDLALISPSRGPTALNHSPLIYPSRLPPSGLMSVEHYRSVSNSLGFGCNLLGSFRPLARSTTSPAWPIDAP
jgi:hypothetical protein